MSRMLSPSTSKTHMASARKAPVSADRAKMTGPVVAEEEEETTEGKIPFPSLLRAM